MSDDASTAVSLEGYVRQHLPSFVVCDVATAETTARMEGGTGSVHCAAISPDGRRFAYGTDWPSFTVFDTRSGNRLNGLSSEDFLGMPDDATPVYSVAFSHDGTLLAGADENGVSVWNVASGEQQSIERLTSGGRTAVAFSPDGKLLAIV